MRKKIWGRRGERGRSSGGVAYLFRTLGSLDDRVEVLSVAWQAEEEPAVLVARRRWSGRGRGGAEEASEATVGPLLLSMHSWPKWIRLEDNLSLLSLSSLLPLSLWLLWVGGLRFGDDGGLGFG